MAKKVITIPATKVMYSTDPSSKSLIRRTAGYARVSTDKEEQATSFKTQLEYYKGYIESRPDLEFVKMYSDEGITGTSTKNREGFNQMISDALDGKIDLIITKSISRFARNTVDTLNTVRKLKEKGIEVYFEKENIWTLDNTRGELYISIMSSIAQEESRSISENTTWGKRKQFEAGKYSIAYSTFLGYDKGPDGRLVVNREQAKLVRKIYSLYLEGHSTTQIANYFNDKGIKTLCKKNWSASTVNRILQNEKYVGDVILQKEYTVDFLTHKRKKNRGELKQYWLKDDHEAIIDRDTFELVQEEIRRHAHYNWYGDKFAGRVICGECGGIYTKKTWHSNDKYRKEVYQCADKYQKNKMCKTPHLSEKEIDNVFNKALAKLIEDKDEIYENALILSDMLLDTKELEKEAEKHYQEAQELGKVAEDLARENAAKRYTSKELRKKYEKAVEDYESAFSNYEKTKVKIQGHQTKARLIRKAAKKLKAAEQFTTMPSKKDFIVLVESIEIFSKEKVIVTFRTGTKYEIGVK